jgi:hypothetical protein
MIHVVGCRSFIAEARVQNRASPFKICDGRSGTGVVFSLRGLQLSTLTITSPFPHTHLHLNNSLTRRTRGRSLGTFKQSSALSDMWEHWTGK